MAVIIVLGGGVAYLVAQPKQWAAKTTVLVAPQKNLPAGLTASFFDTESNGQLPSTVGQMLGLSTFAAAAAKQLGLTPSQANQVSVAASAITGTTLVTVTATGPSKQVASAMADGVVKAAGPAIASLISPYQISVVSGSAPTATQTRSYSLGKFLVVLLVVAVALGVGAQQAALQLDGLLASRRRQRERRRQARRPDRLDPSADDTYDAADDVDDRATAPPYAVPARSTRRGRDRSEAVPTEAVLTEAVRGDPEMRARS